MKTRSNQCQKLTSRVRNDRKRSEDERNWMEDWCCHLSAPSVFAPSLAFGKRFVNSTGSLMQRWHSGTRENEWEGERGRCALWYAASTDEQAVLCPSPTLRNQRMNEWGMRGKREVWRGWIEISVPYFMNGSTCHSSLSTGPAVQVLRKKPCPTGPIMSVVVQFNLFDPQFPILWQLWQYVTLCECVRERDGICVWQSECMSVYSLSLPSCLYYRANTGSMLLSRRPSFSKPSHFLSSLLYFPPSVIHIPPFFPRSLTITPLPPHSWLPILPSP